MRKISGRVARMLVKLFNFGMRYSAAKNLQFEHSSILLFTIIGNARTIYDSNNCIIKFNSYPSDSLRN